MKYQDIVKELTVILQTENTSFPDGRFFSEREIARRYGVSQSTAHRAVAELCRQGYLIQIHGSGTFVTSSRQTQSIFSVTGCGQSYQALGYHPVRRVLRQETIPASATVASNLEIAAGEPVLLLDMLYQADRMSVNETVSYLPLSRFPGAERLDFTQKPLLDILRAHYDAYAKRTQNTLQAIHPSEQIAHNLSISANTPILLFESVTSGLLDGCMQPFEYFLCYYKTDYFRFHVTQDYDMI